MRVWIVGCGYVGARLAEELVASGHSVVASRRPGGAVPRGAEPHPIDLDEAFDAPSGITHVAVCVAPGASTDDAYERIYFRGTQRVLLALERAHLSPRVVFVSSTSVFAEDAGGVVDESSPVVTQGKPHALVRAEALVHAKGGIVLRLAGIYGPGRERMIRMVKEGSATLSNTPAIGNRIHRDD